MIGFLISLADLAGVPELLRKAVGIIGAVLAVLALLSLALCVHDRKLIADHEAKVAAEIAARTRPADERAADTRLSDMKRNMEDEAAERAAVARLPDAGLTARQRARSCAILCRQNPDTVPAGCGPCP